MAGSRPRLRDVGGYYAALGVPLPAGTGPWLSIRCFLPGHIDKHASAGVRADNGVWRCHACGLSGGPFDAAIALGLDRKQAAKLLRAHGLWIERGKPREAATATPAAVASRPASPAATFDWRTASAQPAGGFDWAAAVAAPKPVRRVEYTYTDESGQPLFRVVRSDFADGSKRLFQERFEDGKWVAGLAETRRVLYRLPQVLTQAARGGLVYVVEGEKCADALAKLGFCATCNPGGAGKWREEYTAALQGALIVVVPDCDRAGREHALAVLDALARTGIRCLEPLELSAIRDDGWDVVDELAAVADTLRAVEPTIAPGEVRRRLRDMVLQWTRRLLPYDGSTYRERLTAEREGYALLDCERCGRRRAHRLSHGLAFCPCGGHRGA